MSVLTGETEQERTDQFEELCGGSERAFRLLHIWQHEAWPDTNPRSDRAESKIKNFRRIAGRAGFTEEQIEAFLEL